MTRVEVRRARKADSDGFLSLLTALAEFEHLDPPDEGARKRILRDVFQRKRLNLFVASKGNRLVGYALYFYTYSSFLALPTLYLEDIFVGNQDRKKGIGIELFKRCVEEAVRQGCGRMEWSVLSWNENAIRFYERVGAKRLSDWYTYRLDSKSLRAISSKERSDQS